LPRLGTLTWLCDLDEELRSTFAARYPSVQVTGSFAEMLADRSASVVHRNSRSDAL